MALIWLIDNIGFEGTTIKKIEKICNIEIEFVITNYDNYSDFGEEAAQAFEKHIVPYSYRVMMQSHASIINDCLFVKIDAYPNNVNFTHLMQLCLELVYYTPTIISTPNNTAGGLYMWKGYSLSSTSTYSTHEITSNSFDKVLLYLKILCENYNEQRENIKLIEDVVAITHLHDKLNQLLLLWAFVEGNFHRDRTPDSTLELSYNNMINNYYSMGMAIEEEKIAKKSIRQRIIGQNELFGIKSITQLRNVLAHGKQYQSNEVLNINNWTKEQSAAISNQRDLLIEVIAQSMINKILLEQGK